MPRLNLGSGVDYREGYVNVDIHPAAVLIYQNFYVEDVDVIADLNVGFPFRNGVFDEVLARQVLEHLKDVDMAVMECNRVLRHGGLLKGVVPYFKSDGAYRLAHRFLFSEYDVRSLAKYGFRVLRLERRSPLRLPFKRYLDLFLWNVYRTVEFTFEKKTDFTRA
ncbi:methyltransferase domain-containing protein [Candidatus Bathyarchaeota archaeon]|nr:methyltransferase domain-containing protein [Candidatus Bathyarchaeota archaeon]